MRIPLSFGLILLLAGTAAGQTVESCPAPENPFNDPAHIRASDLLRHIRVLSSDAFEGRAPGTKGEDLTVEYLVGEFERIGLKPGNPDGTYIQDVPLVGITSTPTAAVTADGLTLPLTFPDDYVAVSALPETEVSVENSDIVFVGYGIEAPEYGWDDYKGVDVTGKTLLMLVNDPAAPDPSDANRYDSTFFNGPAMTYYGRWTYKYEIARQKGAAAAVIIHETGPAGYGYQVVRTSWTGENLTVGEENPGPLAIQAWVTDEKAKELLAEAGFSLAELKKRAGRSDFRPVPLGAEATFHTRNEVRQVRSRNVIGLLEGADPRLRNEYVLHTAHWDHLGKNPDLPGDQIFNGALDNATGTAALIELAETYANLEARPSRSVLFLATTAEEQGLLGSTYYTLHPLYPLEKTLAVINIDSMNPWGIAENIVVTGLGYSTLDDLLETGAARQKRYLEANPSTHGAFYRSDHFPFARMGVPAVYAGSGSKYVLPAALAKHQERVKAGRSDYHQPSDEVKPDWDLSGAALDLELLFGIGRTLTETPTWPHWKPGAEFKARREEALRRAGIQ